MKKIRVFLIIGILLVLCGLVHIPVAMRSAENGETSFWDKIVSSSILQMFDCASVAHAYAFLYYNDGNYIRWCESDIPVDYKIGNWWLPDAAEPVGAIYAGYKTWQDVAGATCSFNYQGTTTDVLPAEVDGVNMVAWDAEAFVGGYETNSIGCTCIWYDADTLYIEEVDIALNVGLQWTTTGGANKFDIQGVTTHEVGHLLGLAHSEVLTATMIAGPTFYETHTVGDEASLRTLDADDIAGISVLYPPGYAGAGGGSGGGCFIATAAYGSRLSSEVRVLSDFRDRYLVDNFMGRKFVEVYYRLSPPLAGFIERHPVLRKCVRMQIAPFVKFAGFILTRGN